MGSREKALAWIHHQHLENYNMLNDYEGQCLTRLIARLV